jgi:hypothetical protein
METHTKHFFNLKVIKSILEVENIILMYTIHVIFKNFLK